MANLTRLTFPLSGLEMESDTFSVRMSEYTHDIAVVKIRFWTAFPAATGAPVWLIWGPDNAPTAFVGYFDHSVTTLPTSLDAGSTTIVCVGASYPMKDAGQQVWTDLTADTLAYELADRYQLDADIVPHDRVWPQIVQSGESDWQLLTRVAKSVGYTCSVHQAQLRFYPRTRDFLALQDNAPVFNDPDIYSFSPVLGTAVPDKDREAQATRQLTVVDDDGESVTMVDFGIDPLAGSDGYTPPFTAVSSVPVDSLADADATLLAQREMSRWYITADALLAGDTRVRPAMPIYLGGISMEHYGYWCVLAVEHRVHRELGYRLVLKLGRDSQGQSVSTPTTSSFIQPVAINPITGVDEPSPPQLINGRWVGSRTGPPQVEEEMPDFVRERLSGIG